MAQLHVQFPLEAVLNGNALLGEETEKAFIRLFGVILRLRNILMAFDGFAADDTLSPRDEQDYRSVYTDLYHKWRKKKEDATIINDDLVFEVEFLKQVDINIDYVLMLVQKYHDSNCTDKMIIGDIERAIGASYELRNKKDLIEAFIDSLDSSNDVTADWEKYRLRLRSVSFPPLSRRKPWMMRQLVSSWPMLSQMAAFPRVVPRWQAS